MPHSLSADLVHQIVRGVIVNPTLLLQRHTQHLCCKGVICPETQRRVVVADGKRKLSLRASDQ